MVGKQQVRLTNEEMDRERNMHRGRHMDRHRQRHRVTQMDRNQVEERLREEWKKGRKDTPQDCRSQQCGGYYGRVTT